MQFSHLSMVWLIYIPNSINWTVLWISLKHSIISYAYTHIYIMTYIVYSLLTFVSNNLIKSLNWNIIATSLTIKKKGSSNYMIAINKLTVTATNLVIMFDQLVTAWRDLQNHWHLPVQLSDALNSAYSFVVGTKNHTWLY